jgi:hypothetical protein
MQKRLLAKFWLEVALALISAALLALTIVAPDWMEGLFGAAPDAGDGSAERQLRDVPAAATGDRHEGHGKVPRSILEGARDMARDIAKTDAYSTSRRERKKVELARFLQAYEAFLPSS